MKKNFLGIPVPLYIVVSLLLSITSAAVLSLSYYYERKLSTMVEDPKVQARRLEALLFPSAGAKTGVEWGDIGRRMVEVGVIDRQKILDINGASYSDILDGKDGGNISIDKENSGFVLNFLWAFGLSQKSKVLDEMKSRYGDKLGNFASTGGWTLGKKDALEYFGKAELVKLTDSQQEIVYDITKNIYRPCCDNSTAFPDCNHGMAMLGLVELLVANGYGEEEIYSIALKFNTYWFPDTYATIAKYMEDWENVNPKEILGAAFSSASGYQEVLSRARYSPGGGGSGCGV
ncbi:hypothetical protein HYW61_00725 [candidate division WWE3 bacterium]|nr:hypothetical protein [candidate division WWE3 bacterium]